MDSSLLDTLPADMKDLLSQRKEDFDRALVAGMTEEEVEWLLGMRRTFTVLYSHEGSCTVEHFRTSPEKRMNLGVFGGEVEMDAYAFCTESEGAIGYMLDGPNSVTKEYFSTDLSGRFFPVESPSEHIMSFDSNNKEIRATTILLDIKSVFTVLKRRAQVLQLPDPVAVARKKTLEFLASVHGFYLMRPWLTEMYLTASIIDLGLSESVKYEGGAVSDDLRRRINRDCRKYLALLIEEVSYFH